MVKTKNEIDLIHNKNLASHRGNGHFHFLCMRYAALYAGVCHALLERPSIGVDTTSGISAVGMLSSRWHSIHACTSGLVQMVHRHLGHAGCLLLVLYGTDGSRSLMLKTGQESDTAKRQLALHLPLPCEYREVRPRGGVPRQGRRRNPSRTRQRGCRAAECTRQPEAESAHT